MESHAGKLTLGDLVALVKTLPSLGEEAEQFMKDLKNARDLQPLMQEHSDHRLARGTRPGDGILFFKALLLDDRWSLSSKPVIGGGCDYFFGMQAFFSSLQNDMDYKKLKTYLKMLKLSSTMKNAGIKAEELYEASRKELENRAQC